MVYYSQSFEANSERRLSGQLLPFLCTPTRNYGKTLVTEMLWNECRGPSYSMSNPLGVASGVLSSSPNTQMVYFSGHHPRPSDTVNAALCLLFKKINKKNCIMYTLIHLHITSLVTVTHRKHVWTVVFKFCMSQYVLKQGQQYLIRLLHYEGHAISKLKVAVLIRRFLSLCVTIRQ